MIDWDPIPSAPTSSPAVTPVVIRGGAPMPNVECLSVSVRVGAEPGSARFRYRFDQLHPEWPSSVEEVFALSAPGVWSGSPYVVAHEDYLEVWLPIGDGEFEPIFSGFAQMPQANYGGQEAVTFEAIGAPVRCWDFPIAGAFQRDASDPEAGDVIATDLPTRFNPDGKANATPEGFDHEITGSTGATEEAPVFLDPLYLDQFQPGDPDAPGPEDLENFGRRWSLAMAARYLIAGGNVDQEWVVNPDLDALDLLLSSVKPSEDFAYIDWSDPSTYEVSPIIIGDLDVTGLSWPEALERVLTPHGFGMAFVCGAGSSGLEWRLIIRRNDDNTYWKTLGLQARGSTLDPSLTAVDGFAVQRDGLLANQVMVDTAPERFEASFLLAPVGWAVTATDADAADRPKWIRGQATFDPLKYRVFGADECGEGHWVFGVADLGAEETDPPDLAGALDPDGEAPERPYVRRRRPALRDLISRDAAGEPRKAELWIGLLSGHTAQVPGVYRSADWAGVQWQQVTEGGWALHPDRLGIIVTTEDVRSWHITKEGDRPVIPAGVLDLVKSQAAPSDTVPKMPRVAFRLTCVIEGDRGLPEAKAEKRAESPSLYTVERRVDGRDRYRRETIAASSHLSGGETTRPRDDSDEATSYAEAIRREREAVRFAGTLSIPRITTGVRLCDKVIGLAGRDLYFGVYTPGTDEGDRYPMVVGVDWSFDGAQATRLMLADRRAEGEA